MSDKSPGNSSDAANAREIEAFIADAAGGDYNAVKDFVKKHKGDIDKRNEIGWNALSLAAHYGHRLVVEILLENGADFNTVDRDIMSALLYAASRGYSDVAKLLLEKGANFNQKNKAGWTSLMLAVKNNHMTVIKLLLARENLKLDEKNEDGDTALMIAVWNRHADTTALLIKTGAALGIMNSSGKTALQLAEISEEQSIIKLLKAAEAKKS